MLINASKTSMPTPNINHYQACSGEQRGRGRGATRGDGSHVLETIRWRRQASDGLGDIRIPVAKSRSTSKPREASSTSLPGWKSGDEFRPFAALVLDLLDVSHY
jgi:hypothetical protein